MLSYRSYISAAVTITMYYMRTLDGQALDLI